MTDPIADRLAVQDVMTHYATSVDGRDFALHASVFTQDVVVSGFTREPLVGLDAWMAFARHALERFGATQHLIGNYVVEVRGDAATMRTYVQATHVLAANPQQTLTLWATYHDELVRDGEVWRISSHRLEPHHQEIRGGVQG